MPSKKNELAADQPQNESSAKPKRPAIKKAASATGPSATKPASRKSVVAEVTIAPRSNSTAPTVAELAQAQTNAAGPDTPSLATTSTAPVRPKLSRDEFKRLALKAAIVVVALFVLVTVVFGVLIYGYKSENPAVDAVSAVIPFPAERVNGSFVGYHDYLFEVNANERAYQNNAKLNNQPAVDFNSADGKKLVQQIKQHALDKLKSDTIIAQLASQKKVTVTNNDVTTLLGDLYKRYGGQATLLKTLKQIYGWDLGDLQGVVRKQLLAQKLQAAITSDPSLYAQAQAKAQDVLNKVKAGGDFTALAKQYSQASDASTGGDLGNVSAGQLPDVMQKAIDALQPGQVSDLIKTTYGYEIIKVIDKSGATTHAQHIAINTIDFNTYLNNQLSKAKTNTYIKI